MADKLIVDGVEYDMPADFTIGEARILKRYTGMNLADLEDADPSNPDYMAAVIHVAFARSFRIKGTFEQIEEEVNKVELAKIDARGDDHVPLTIAPSSASGENAPPSGEGGGRTGETSPATLNPNGSGMPGSDTGATSRPETSPGLHRASSTAALT